MANTGWIRLHRKIVENELLWDPEVEPFSRGQAWMDLVMAVNHKDKDVLIGKNLVRVNRGQKITSVRKLCARWGWGRHKVEDYLKLLVEHGMLVVEGTPHGTLVTVVNYELYQSNEDDEGTETDEPRGHEETNLGDTNRLAQGTQTDDKQECIKNDKNVKNEKNDKELLNNNNAGAKGSDLPNPFHEVKNEMKKAAGDKARKKQDGSLDELEDQLSRSGASEELKEAFREFWHWRKEVKKIPMTSKGIRMDVSRGAECEVKFGKEIALECFNITYEMNYRGVFFNDKMAKWASDNLKKDGGIMTYDKNGKPAWTFKKSGQQAIDWSSL